MLCLNWITTKTHPCWYGGGGGGVCVCVCVWGGGGGVLLETGKCQCILIASARTTP